MEARNRTHFRVQPPERTLLSPVTEIQAAAYEEQAFSGSREFEQELVNGSCRIRLIASAPTFVIPCALRHAVALCRHGIVTDVQLCNDPGYRLWGFGDDGWAKQLLSK